MQRKLAEEGTSFQGMLDGIRVGLARGYLDEGRRTGAGGAGLTCVAGGPGSAPHRYIGGGSIWMGFISF